MELQATPTDARPNNARTVLQVIRGAALFWSSSEPPLKQKALFFLVLPRQRPTGKPASVPTAAWRKL